MADFDSLVMDTTTTVQRFFEHAAQVQERVTAAQTQLAAVSEQTEADASTLSEAAASLLEDIESGRAALASEAAEVRQALQQLGERLQALQGQVEHEHQDTQQALAALRERVEGLQTELEATLHEVEASLTALHQRVEATDAELQDTIAQAEEHLQAEVTSVLQTQQADIDQRSAALQAYMSTEVLPQMAEKAAAFAAHLAEVVDKLTARSQELEQSTAETARASIQVVGEVQRENLGHLVRTAGELAVLMERLRDFIDTTSSDIVTTKDVLVDGANTTNIGLRTALGLLEEIEELLRGV